MGIISIDGGTMYLKGKNLEAARAWLAMLIKESKKNNGGEHDVEREESESCAGMARNAQK